MRKRVIRKNVPRVLCLSVVLCVFSMFSNVIAAKSLYIAGGAEGVRNPSDPIYKSLWVYDVKPDGTLAFQAMNRFPGDNDLNFVNGLTMDTKNHIMFVTYLGSENASLLDSQTLQWLRFAYMVPVDMYPGGIVYDEKNTRIYVTDLGKDRLIVYNWDFERKLFLDIPYKASSVYLEAENSGAIAFDYSKDLVYVASKTPDVQVLKTAMTLSKWTPLGRIPLDFVAKSLGVDSKRQLLYAGGTVLNDATVIQYDLNTHAVKSRIVGHEQGTVLSISVDNSTSLVYTLIGETYLSQSTARIVKVLDTSLDTFLSMPFTGLARRLYIPSTSMGYNPLLLTLTPVSGVETVNGEYVSRPGSVIEYQACMTNSNVLPVTDVILKDALPGDLDFVKAIPSGNAISVYSQQNRTYQYYLAKLDSKETHCFRLFAKVKDSVMPGVTVSNSMVLDSNETPSSSATVDVKIEHNPMGLTKTVVMDPNLVLVGNTYYVDPGSLLTYQLCMSNLTNENSIADVLLVDYLPAEVDFISADEGGVSFYNPTNHTYTWAFDKVEPNYVDCFNLVVRVKDTVLPGQVITNEAVLEGNEVSSVSTEVNVVTKYKALKLTLGIKPGVDYDPVENTIRRGGLITYAIDVKNMDLKNAVQEIVLVDSLPEGMSYVSADFDGTNGQYDPMSHTVRITRPALLAGQGFHVELTFAVNTDVLPGTVLTNKAIATANGVPASSASVSVKVFYANNLVLPTPKIYYTAPLLRNDHKDELMFDMTFPAYINLADINTTQPLTLSPGNAKSYNIKRVSGLRTTYKVYGADGKVRIQALFDRQPLLNTLLAGQTKVTVSVTGLLVSGQQFTATLILPVK